MQRFLREYYIHNAERITFDSVLDAFRLIYKTPFIHPGILTNYRSLEESNSTRHVFVTPMRVSRALGAASEENAAAIICNEAGLPLFYQCYALPPDQIPLLENGDPVYISGVFDQRFPAWASAQGRRFLCRATTEDIAALLPDADIAATVAAEADYLPFQDYGYRVLDYGNLRVIVLRASAGHAPKLSAQFREPRDLLVTNMALSGERLMRLSVRLYDIESAFFELALPPDMGALLRHFTGGEMQDMLANIHFMRLFLEGQLTHKLTPMGLTAADAYAICRSVRILRLEYGGRRQYIHSVYTPQQTELLNVLAFS